MRRQGEREREERTAGVSGQEEQIQRENETERTIFHRVVLRKVKDVGVLHAESERTRADDRLPGRGASRGSGSNERLSRGWRRKGQGASEEINSGCLVD